MATVRTGNQLGPTRATVRAAPKPAAPIVEGGGVLLVLFSRSEKFTHMRKQLGASDNQLVSWDLQISKLGASDKFVIMSQHSRNFT